MDEASKHIADCLLAAIEKGGAILTSGGVDGVPTIHDIAGQYHNSVRHLGFGFFDGKTPSGTFSFCGGGAMYSIRGQDDTWLVSWTYLRASPEVLADLGYDLAAVVAALEAI